MSILECADALELFIWLCDMCQATRLSSVLPICYAVCSSQSASVIQEAAMLKLHSGTCMLGHVV